MHKKRTGAAQRTGRPPKRAALPNLAPPPAAVKWPADFERRLRADPNLSATEKQTLAFLFEKTGGFYREIAFVPRFEFRKLGLGHRKPLRRRLERLAALGWIKIADRDRRRGIFYLYLDADGPDSAASKPPRNKSQVDDPCQLSLFDGLETRQGASAPPQGASAPPQGASAPPQGASAPPQGASAPPAIPSTPHPMGYSPRGESREDDDDDDLGGIRVSLASIPNEAITARVHKAIKEEMEHQLTLDLLRETSVAAVISFLIRDEAWLYASARAAKNPKTSAKGLLWSCLIERLPGATGRSLTWKRDRCNELKKVAHPRASAWLAQFKSKSNPASSPATPTAEQTGRGEAIFIDTPRGKRIAGFTQADQ